MKLDLDIDVQDFLTLMFESLNSAKKQHLCSRYIKVASKIIKLNFTTREQMELATVSLSRVITNVITPVDSEYFYWCDDMLLSLGAKNIPDNVWLVKKNSDDFFVSFNRDKRLVAVDKKARKFYCCISSNCSNTEWVARGLVNFFKSWADLSDILITHSALVGVGQNGALIVGMSGAGKSTLALSSMLFGMKFVSDEYTLITKEDSTVGYALYSIAGICDNMAYCLLKENMRVVYCDEQRGKKQVDISEYDIEEKLKISVLLAIHQTDEVIPKFVKCNDGHIATKLIYSSLKEFGDLHNQRYIKNMIYCLKGIPSYDFYLTKNIEENQKFLQKFLQNF